MTRFRILIALSAIIIAVAAVFATTTAAPSSTTTATAATTPSLDPGETQPSSTPPPVLDPDETQPSTTTSSTTTTTSLSTTPTTTTTTALPTTTTTTTATPTTTTTAPPSGTCTQTAAARFNWGTPSKSDDFNTKPASPKWNVYGPYAGHAGNGLWTPNAVSASGGIMTITGNARGETGGMALSGGQFRGRWEVCMKTAPGSANYSPVMLLWASSTGGVNSPGGEVDFMEIPGNPSRQRVSFFLHWPNSSGRSSTAINIDATRWHSWAVEWTATGIVGYVDGVEWFRDSNPNHSPSRSAALCLQLSNMGGDISAGGRMDFDWARQY